MDDGSHHHHGIFPNVNPSTAISSPTSPHHQHPNKELDRFLPIANVGRIMKKAIPSNGKISKDAKEAVQECVSEFISFVTGEASDKCQREKRKTINGDDVIWAVTILGFEDYVGPLKTYLSKYRETEDEKLGSNVNKQQQQQLLQQGTAAEQRIPGHGEESGDNPHNNLGGYGVVYSPPPYFLPHHRHQGGPFLGADQTFGLPFPAGPIPEHDRIDSGGACW